MNAVSQNGWPVITEARAAQGAVSVWTIPGQTRNLSLRLRHGPAGLPLAHWVLWLDRNIEDVEQGADDWGYAYRPIGDSDEWSNHASATAVDLNSLRHAQGERGTWTEEQRDHMLDSIAGRYRSVIRAGFTYRRTADDMHFEYARGRTEVVELAEALYYTNLGKRLREANPWFDWQPGRGA